MSVVVRFAPSPTGYLHIGGARSALFNYLFAKHHQGKFLLRIEDTDQERSTTQAIDAILQGLEFLELKFDEPYVLQSKNHARHVEIANKLLENNQAYQCFVSNEELEAMRIEAEKKGQIFRFHSPYRNKINSQTSVNKPVIRLKSPQDGETIINDLVQGKVSVKNQELDDLVLLRSDQTPTYMLAVVVDDHDMNITHVIRGDDHLTNTFKQKIIYQAMNWHVPEFAHIPLIHGNDGAKLSKRHGATSVIEYQKMGYLSEAIRNYLLRLGWSHGDDEIISDQQAIEWFNIENIGKSPSRFDFAKLNHLNHHYLKQKNQDQLLDIIKQHDYLNHNQEELNRFKKALKFIKEKTILTTDLAKELKIYQDHFNLILDDELKNIVVEKKSWLEELLTNFQQIQDWNHDQIKNQIDQFAIAKNLKIKDFAPVLRIVLTFSKSSSGGIFEVIEILGKDLVIARIKNSLSF